MYRTVIVLKNNKFLSKNGTREEVESFIFENLDNMKRTRTVNKTNGELDSELTMTA